MKYSSIIMSELKTYADCATAIDSIEEDYHNYHGGMGSWCSGFETVMYKTARNKVIAIENKMNKIKI